MEKTAAKTVLLTVRLKEVENSAVITGVGHFQAKCQILKI